jgi:hypothetical protein
MALRVGTLLSIFRDFDRVRKSSVHRERRNPRAPLPEFRTKRRRISSSPGIFSSVAPSKPCNSGFTSFFNCGAFAG